METTSSATAATQTAPHATPRALGAEDWRHLYMVTGFALVIEGILVDIILGNRAPAALLIWVVLGALTIVLAIYNPGTRASLLQAKERFEADHGSGPG